MDLQSLMAIDNAALLDYVGSAAVLTNKSGQTANVRAVLRDISQHIDLQSGFSVGVRQISAVISFKPLKEQGYNYTKNGANTITGDKIKFTADGEVKEYEIIESRPDNLFENFTVIADVCGQREKNDGKFSLKREEKK